MRGLLLGTALLAMPGAMRAAEDLMPQLLTVKRVYVDRLTGGETWRRRCGT